jgi:acyl carrier protein
MNSDKIIDKINTVLAAEFEVDPGIITPDAPLMATLDMDSLDLVDVVVLIEQNFGVTLRGDDFVGMNTFQNFYDLIINKMNG